MVHSAPQAPIDGSRLFPEGLHGIIFDCDGVILDSRYANREFYNRILAHFGCPPMTAEQEEFSFMATAQQVLEFLLPQQYHSHIDDVTRRVVVYQRDIAPLLRLYDDVRTFLDWLCTARKQLAIQTNRRYHGTQSVLDIFSLQNYFFPVVTASNVAPKPSPEGIQHILQAWECEPQHVLFVGDSIHDQEAAAAAGVAFAAIHNPKLHGDIVAATFLELQQQLRPVVETNSHDSLF